MYKFKLMFDPGCCFFLVGYVMQQELGTRSGKLTFWRSMFALPNSPAMAEPMYKKINPKSEPLNQPTTLKNSALKKLSRE
jgi:hypothetical protein